MSKEDYNRDARERLATQGSMIMNPNNPSNPVIPEDTTLFAEDKPGEEHLESPTVTTTTSPSSSSANVATSTSSTKTATPVAKKNANKYYCQVSVDNKGTYGNCVSSRTGLPPVSITESGRVVEESIGPFDNLKSCEALCLSKNKKNETTPQTDEGKISSDTWKAILQGLFFAALALTFYALLRYFTIPKEKSSLDYFNSLFNTNTSSSSTNRNLANSPSAPPYSSNR
jgi:hypothetical protein